MTAEEVQSKDDLKDFVDGLVEGECVDLTPEHKAEVMEWWKMQKAFTPIPQLFWVRVSRPALDVIQHLAGSMA